MIYIVIGIIVVLIAMAIIAKIISVIYEGVGKAVSKTTVSMQKNNPEAALRTVIKSRELMTFTGAEYRDHLKKIVEDTGYVKAMVKLNEFYEEGKPTKSDLEQAEMWRKRAAEAGDLDSITQIYFKVNTDNVFYINVSIFVDK